jgi:hypothetical protein
MVCYAEAHFHKVYDGRSTGNNLVIKGAHNQKNVMIFFSGGIYWNTLIVAPILLC